MYWVLALGVFRMLSSKKLYNVHKDLMGTFNWGLLNSLQANTFVNVLAQKNAVAENVFTSCFGLFIIFKLIFECTILLNMLLIT